MSTSRAHKLELSLVIGNKNLSSWSLRPWLVLRHADIPFVEHVFLFEEAGWRERIVALSPSRRVPALRIQRPESPDEEQVIWDSLAICEYVAELYPELHLWPEDRSARAVARSVSAEMHSGFGSLRKDLSMDVVLRAKRTARSFETQADIDRAIQIWHDCRARFGARTSEPFLFGAFSIADAMFAPVVFRFRSYDVEVGDPLARAWYEAMLDLPAMQAWERDAAQEVARAQPGPTAPDPTSAQHCYAVIFSSQRRGGGGGGRDDDDGYAAAASAMVELARAQPGFLGVESARGADGFGLTVSYWESLPAIAAFKSHADHRRVQARGRESFYERYEVRVACVERGYKWSPHEGA